MTKNCLAFILFFFLTIDISLAQVGFKKIGGINYPLETGRYTTGDCQTIKIEALNSFFVVLKGKIKSGAIKVYKPKSISDDFFDSVKGKEIDLYYVTYEGFNACTNVDREYIKVEFINTNKALMLHRDEFEKFITTWKKGQHKAI